MTNAITNTPSVCFGISNLLVEITLHQIPLLMNQQNDLIQRSSEAITVAKRLEVEASTLFQDAHEMQVPLQYDFVDTWSHVLGIFFVHPSTASQTSHSHDSSFMSMQNSSHSKKKKNSTHNKSNKALIQKRMSNQLILDPTLHPIRALQQLDEAIVYFDSILYMSSSSSSSSSSMEEYTQRGQVVREEK